MSIFAVDGDGDDCAASLEDVNAFRQACGLPLIKASQQIKIVKQPDLRVDCKRRDALLRRIGNAQSELGRLNKLLDEIRADVLHLTTD